MALDGQSAESRKAKRSETRAKRSCKDMSRYHGYAALFAASYCNQYPTFCICFDLLALSFLPRGGDSNMKGAGMLVVSLRGVNFRFWFRLGCSGRNTVIFSRKGLF